MSEQESRVDQEITSEGHMSPGGSGAPGEGRGTGGGTGGPEEFPWLGFLIFAVFVLALVLFVPSLRDWAVGAIRANLVGVIVLGVVLAVLIGLFIVVPGFRAWLKQAPVPKKTAVLTFLLGPLLLLAVICISFLENAQRIVLLRVGFIVVACLLPGAMFYLFIATRKVSLLNEFVANMVRLGVAPGLPLSDGSPNDPRTAEMRNRVDAYFRKFEAMYGPVSEQLFELSPGRGWLWAPRRASTGAGGGGLFVSEAAVPVLTATFLLALMWTVVLPLPHPALMALARAITGRPATMPALTEIGDVASAFVANLTPVTAAFLGAYFFSLQMLFRRYVRRDLRPSAYIQVTLRILLAIIGIWVLERVLVLEEPVGRVAPEDVVKVVGFAIGMFPRIAWQYVQGWTKRFTSTAVLPGVHSALPISDLDGLTVWHEARFEEEDIENIPNMATADLLELMLNTRVAPDRLVDWVDQAILYTYLGPDSGEGDSSRRRRLRTFGIRTATALTRLYDGVRETDRDHLGAFEGILAGDGWSQLRSLRDAVETNPNLPLVRRWRESAYLAG